MGKGLSDLQKHILAEAHKSHVGEWPRHAVTVKFDRHYGKSAAQALAALEKSIAAGGTNWREKAEAERAALAEILASSGFEPQWPEYSDYAVLAYRDTRSEADVLLAELQERLSEKPIELECKLLLASGKQPSGDLEVWRIFATFYGFPVRRDKYGRKCGVRSAGREAEYRSARAAVSRAMSRLEVRDLALGLHWHRHSKARWLVLTPSGAALAEKLSVNFTYVSEVNRYEHDPESSPEFRAAVREAIG